VPHQEKIAVDPGYAVDQGAYSLRFNLRGRWLQVVVAAGGHRVPS
jgi:hypothetical protein